MSGRIRKGVAIAWGIFAFLSGGLVGGLVADHFLGKVYRDALSHARMENQRLSDDLASSMGRGDTQEEGVEHEKSLPRPVKSTEKVRYADMRPRRKNPDLQELASKYGDPDSGDEFLHETTVEDYLVEGEGPRDDPPLKAPFQISAEDFEKDYQFVDVSNLSYYQEDGALVDERDAIILEPATVVGERGLEILADTMEDTVYFHNDEFELNYEVDVMHGMSYRRDVLGQEYSEEGLAKDDDIDE